MTAGHMSIKKLMLFTLGSPLIGRSLKKELRDVHEKSIHEDRYTWRQLAKKQKPKPCTPNKIMVHPSNKI
jgi:hypothetical protein